MALVATAAQVSNLDATPVTKSLPSVRGGAIRTAFGYLGSASFVGGTAGQWYTFVRVPARARVLGIYVTNATSTTGSVKVGLYRPNSGIAIDDDCFNTNFVIGANNSRADAAPVTVYTVAQRDAVLSSSFATIVSTAGATSDTHYDIALTIVTVLGSAVDALVEVDYVMDE